jgi:hypothetical protein
MCIYIYTYTYTYIYICMTSAQVSLSSADALTPVIRELVLRCPSGLRKMDEAWTR